MKKIIILSYLVLLGGILSCATTQPITQSDLPDLKGKWKGTYQDRVTATYIQPVELEIEGFKDLTVKGRVTWSHADRPPTSFPFYGKIATTKKEGLEGLVSGLEM